MTVSLKPEIQAFLERKVRNGEYASAEEAANSLLQRFISHAELSDSDLDELKAKVAVGIEQADRGELEPWDPDEIWAEAERRYAERQGKRAG